MKLESDRVVAVLIAALIIALIVVLFAFVS